MPRNTPKSHSKKPLSSGHFNLPALIPIAAFICAAAVAAAGLLWWINRPSPPLSDYELKQLVSGKQSGEFIDAAELMPQFLECIKVTSPKGNNLKALLPLGDYDEFNANFQLDMRAEKALSLRDDEQIDACSGINRLYEMKPSIEQQCACKIDIICPC